MCRRSGCVYCNRDYSKKEVEEIRRRKWFEEFNYDYGDSK